MTEEELRRCRAVRDGLKIRLRQLKNRLRGIVIEQDCLGLGGKNFMVLMKSAADRVEGFGYCVDTAAAQSLAGFLKDTCLDELALITSPLKDELLEAAGDAIAQRMTPAAAWTAIAEVFDTETKDKLVDFAFRVGTGADLKECAP